MEKYADKIKSILVDKAENVIYVLGNNYAEQFFSTGVLGQGFAVLSDKRVYFRGKCFVRNGKKFFSKTEEKTVDLEDVTGSGFVYNRNLVTTILFYVVSSLVIVSLLFVLLDFLELFSPLVLVPYIALFVYYIRTRKKWALITLLAIPAGIPLLLYAIMKATNYSLFEVSFAGGGIGFDVHWIPKQDAVAFQNVLRLAKDKKKATGKSREPAIVIEKNSENNDYFASFEAVKQLKELEKQGIISNEEFEKKKKEILKL